MTKEIQNIIERELKSFEKKSNTSFARGGFLTTDLGDSFRVDVELQKSFLSEFSSRLLEQVRLELVGEIEELPAFTSCSDKQMGKVSDDAKKPMYGTNYLERESVIAIINRIMK